jgi:hypothetical protein
MSEKETTTGCGQAITCGSSPSAYCEWFYDGEWRMANAVTPYHYYCVAPSREPKDKDAHVCNYPCYMSGSMMPLRGTAKNDVRDKLCRVTYCYWKGDFHIVHADSIGGGSAPASLEEYSRTQNTEFSFLVAFEFPGNGYCRGTYKFKEGAFLLLEGSTSGAQPVPDPLSEYSKNNLSFYFLVALEFYEPTGTFVMPQ